MDSPKRDSVRRHLSPEERQTVLTRQPDGSAGVLRSGRRRAFNVN